jgi:hypothetical protein
VDYCSFQAVECYRDYYLPLFRLCAAEMDEAAKSGKKPKSCFASPEFRNKRNDLWRRFWDKPLAPVSEQDGKAPSVELAGKIYGNYASAHPGTTKSDACDSL